MIFRRLFSPSTSRSAEVDKSNSFPDDPFGQTPHADKEVYLNLHQKACEEIYPEIDAFEKEYGFAVDRPWMNDLALHTQCVVKKSPLNYSHGRILYAVARRYLDRNPGRPVTFFETGTARGFSAVVMSKALEDAKAEGHIVTLDMLAHHHAMIWNCIDDWDGKKSRSDILHPWAGLARRVTFLRGTTDDLLPRLGMGRIGLAFLDATHEEENVLQEFEFVSARQEKGDIILFDDVTPALFPGVVAAVNHIESEGNYAIHHIRPSESRAYAVGERIS